MKIKRTVAGAGAALCAAVLMFGGGAASGSQGTAAAAPVEVQAIGRYSTPESAQTLNASDYVAVVRALNKNREHAPQTDAELAQAGRDLCAEIDAGATWETFVDQIEAVAPQDYDFYRTIIRTAVFTFCPENGSVLR